ncbi:hypothetical protein P7C71_g2047, partial [Lecanoromycetidae sp. Uapishka_2]
MAGKLPMKVRVDLRDLWDKEDCPAKKSISALKELIGLPVTVMMEPTILWSELQKHYPDQGTFIPSLTAVIQAWADVLKAKLADESNSEWTDNFLEKVSEGRGGIKARVEARAGTRVVSTFLSKPDSAFIISIPETTPSYRGACGYFTTDFAKILEQDLAPPQENDDWTSVGIPIRSQTHFAASDTVVSTALPTLDSLDRPEVLFARQTPYHLMVRVIHDGILVFGSHQGSLELLAEYLQQYVRNIDNPNVKQQILKTELQKSHLGYGALFDSLSVKPSDHRGRWEDINPILILAFVEGVLGYHPVREGSEGNQWYFKRDVPFRG